MKQSKKPSESEWEAVETGLLVEFIHITVENKLNNEWKLYLQNYNESKRKANWISWRNYNVIWQREHQYEL